MKLLFAAFLALPSFNASAETVITGRCEVELYEKIDAANYHRVETGTVSFNNESVEKKIVSARIGGQIAIRNYGGSHYFDAEGITYIDELGTRWKLGLVDSDDYVRKDKSGMQTYGRYTRIFSALFHYSSTGKPHRLDIECVKTYEWK